jgi:hypothetical protein
MTFFLALAGLGTLSAIVGYVVLGGAIRGVSDELTKLGVGGTGVNVTYRGVVIVVRQPIQGSYVAEYTIDGAHRQTIPTATAIEALNLAKRELDAASTAAAAMHGFVAGVFRHPVLQPAGMHHPALMPTEAKNDFFPELYSTYDRLYPAVDPRNAWSRSGVSRQW